MQNIFLMIAGVRLAPYHRLSAVGANLLTYFIRFGCACRRGLPGGNGYVGPALHPQGTLSLDPYRRKIVVLLMVRFGLRLRRGLPGGNGYAGPALHPQGTLSLDPNSAKLSFCLWWGR